MYGGGVETYKTQKTIREYAKVDNNSKVGTLHISSINHHHLHGPNSSIIVPFRSIVTNGTDLVEFYGHLISFFL